MAPCRCINCITPPHMLKKLLESKNKDIRQAAINTLVATARLRGERAVRGQMSATAAPGNGRRTVFDLQKTANFSTARVARSEDGPASPDASANRAFEGLGATRDFYKDIFNRNSINGMGMRLDAYVHYQEDDTGYGNAFWDGQKMVFGDGDGILFADFTTSLDVIAHELTHGVTEFSAGLEYHKEPGALNESLSDVFGSLVKQWSLGQTAAQADWLIGAEVFTPGIGADALRSMKAPGTAYDHPDLGQDPQPDHWDRYVNLPDTFGGDWGGVHINSGIPNKAFYLVAMAIGGHAWDAAGHIWYEALHASSALTNFQQFADTTALKAEALYGAASLEQQAVQDAWRAVGIRVSGATISRGRGRGPAPAGGRPEHGDASLAALAKQIEHLSSQVAGLAKDVGQLKSRKA